MKYKKEQYTDNSYLRAALGENLYKKIICSILKVQLDITKNFNLPIGGDYIYFAGDTLIWSITGENIPQKDLDSFYYRKNRDEVKEYAIKSLKRSQILSSLDLKKIEIIISDGSTIEIYPKDRKLVKKNTQTFFSRAFFVLKKYFKFFRKFDY